MSYIFHDVEQNTDDWMNLRIGKITSSKLGCIMANYGKAFGDPAKKYAVDIAMEQITSRKAAAGYSNDDMARGHEDEPIAREAYQDRFFCEVTNGGFYELGDYGCSPDGHVDHNGLIEIKSAIVSVHYERIRKQSCDSTTYHWQMLGNLKAAEKEYIDFVSYCQDFHDDGKLFVIRHYAETFAPQFIMIDKRLNEFREIIAEAKETILKSEYSIDHIV